MPEATRQERVKLDTESFKEDSEEQILLQLVPESVKLECTTRERGVITEVCLLTNVSYI